MFIRKLPVENPDQLVFFDWSSGPRRLSRGYSGNSSTDPETKLTVGSSFSIRTYERFRAESQTLSDVMAFVPRGTVNINVDGQADLAQAQLVSGNYFAGLRVPAVIGRTIVPEDDQPSASPIAVIGYRYWLAPLRTGSGNYRPESRSRAKKHAEMQQPALLGVRQRTESGPAR